MISAVDLNLKDTDDPSKKYRQFFQYFDKLLHLLFAIFQVALNFWLQSQMLIIWVTLCCVSNPIIFRLIERQFYVKFSF